MSFLYVFLSVLLILLCLAVNVLILAQGKRAQGISGSITGMGGQTYYDKNKGRSLEGQLERYTKILGAAFVIIALALNLVL